MGWIEVAVPLKWFEDCHLSPVLGWNLTVSMEAQLLGTRSLSGLEQSEDRETSCLKDGCEEKDISLEMTVNLEKDKFLTVGI